MSANRDSSPRKRRGDAPELKSNKKLKRDQLENGSKEGEMKGKEKKKEENGFPNGNSFTEQENEIKEKQPLRNEIKNNDATNGDPNSTITAVQLHTRTKFERKKKPKLETVPEKWSWTVSKPIGGRIAPIDPVFSLDEKHILLASRQYMTIYSTSTSLAVRRLHINGKGIVSAKLSPSNPDLVYIADSSGFVQLWKWRDGENILTVTFEGEILCCDITSSSVGDENMFILTRSKNSKKGDKTTEIQTCYIEVLEPSPIISLHKLPDLCDKIQVLEGGKYITAASSNAFFIGISEKQQHIGNAYSWKSYDVVNGLTCFEARYTPRILQSSQKSKAQKFGLDVAIGCHDGAIYMYQDIFSNNKIPLIPRKLHWHRKAVGSLKWSKDGHYLISGGSETVLILWQLETSRQQNLPHLTSTINQIVVSPSGSSYAIGLDDNSVIILSTSELAPTASIGGIQTTSPTASQLSKEELPISLLPADVNCKSVEQLQFAVPASISASTSTICSPFLQSYDWTINRHIKRQALARNNVTNINITPKGKLVQEANIILMKSNYNGSWLATVEEWLPDSSDQQNNYQNRECYLKFWFWNEKISQWILQTRIDSPHQSETLIMANRVLDLASDPSGDSFSTIGQDGIVRVWTPKTRLRDGRVIKGAQEGGDILWMCSRAVDIEKSMDESELNGESKGNGAPLVGKICFSEDGSLIAVSMHTPKPYTPGLVHFIDVASANIKASQPLVYGDSLSALAFLNRNLIVLSSELRVWDVVASSLVFGYPLKKPNPLSRSDHLFRHLAISRSHSRFAIAFSSGKSSEIQTQIAIFDPTSPIPCLIDDLPASVMALIALPGTTGFATVDSDAEVRIIRLESVSILDAIQLGQAMETGNNELDQQVTLIEDSVPNDDADEQSLSLKGAAGPGFDDDSDQSDAEEDEMTTYKPVVGSHQLADVFSTAPAFALPPVQELYRSVASLYIGKPTKTKKESENDGNQKFIEGI